MKKILILLALLITVNSFAQRRQYNNSQNRENAGFVLMISGVAFTTAAILETGQGYGTWVASPTPNSPYNSTYVTPGFWQQTPRNIMLVVGVSFTFTGLITQIHNKNK